MSDFFMYKKLKRGRLPWLKGLSSGGKAVRVKPTDYPWAETFEPGLGFSKGTPVNM